MTSHLRESFRAARRTFLVAWTVRGDRSREAARRGGASVWRLDNCGDQVASVFKQAQWGGPVNDQECAILGEQIFNHGASVPFNPTAALTSAWCGALKAGVYLGRPRGTEFDVGRFRCQEFERGVTWAERANWANHGYDVGKAVATKS